MNNVSFYFSNSKQREKLVCFFKRTGFSLNHRWGLQESTELHGLLVRR